MTIERKTYQLQDGVNFIQAAELANTVILRVEREGLGYNVTQTATPSDREVYYTSGDGKLLFLNPGASVYYNPPGTSTDVLKNELVKVLFKFY